MPGPTPDGFSQQGPTKLSPAPTFQRQPDVAPFKTLPMLAPHGHKRIPPAPPHPPHPRNVRQQHRAAGVTASLSSHLRRRRRCKGPHQSGRLQFGRTAGRRQSVVRKTATPDKLASLSPSQSLPPEIYIGRTPPAAAPGPMPADWLIASHAAHAETDAWMPKQRRRTPAIPTCPPPPAVPPGSLTDPAYRAGAEQSIKPPVTPLKTLRRLFSNEGAESLPGALSWLYGDAEGKPPAEKRPNNRQNGTAATRRRTNNHSEPSACTPTARQRERAPDRHTLHLRPRPMMKASSQQNQPTSPRPIPTRRQHR